MTSVVLLICAWAFFLSFIAAAEPMPMVLMVEESDVTGQALGRLLEAQLKDKAQMRWVSYSAESLGDPLYKGKLLAALTASRLVVSVGNQPTSLAFMELEDIPIYFVGATLISGSGLLGPQVGGIFGYSTEDTLGAVPKKWKRGVGLLYGPGYDDLAAGIAAEAKAAGIHLLERRVARITQMPKILDALIPEVQAVWILGDPALSRGAGFEFLVEESLKKNMPLIGSDIWSVKRGAVFCSLAKPQLLAEKASQNIMSLLEKGPVGPRVEMGPAGGQIIYHPGLAARFHLRPQGPAWTAAR